MARDMNGNAQRVGNRGICNRRCLYIIPAIDGIMTRCPCLLVKSTRVDYIYMRLVLPGIEWM